MADFSVGTNDPAAVKAYSRTTFKQAIVKTIAYRLAQMSSSLTSQENIVQLFDDTAKGPGDSIKYTLFAKLSQRGVTGDDVVSGQGEVLSLFTQDLKIDQLRFIVNLKGAMSQQRIPQSLRDVARVRLADLWAERMDLFLINQATGNTFQSDVAYTGLQATSAPTAGNWVFTSTTAATDTEAELSATGSTGSTPDSFAPTYLLDVIYKAHNNLYPIKPIMLKGMQINGVALLHPGQVRDLKKAYSAGAWGDIQKAAMAGGQVTGNPIFTGSIGMLEGVVLHEDANMPFGNGAGAGTDAAGVNPGRNLLNVANVARGVFMGAQALSMAFGRAQGLSMEKIKWVETLFDANNQLEIVAGKVVGCIKNKFNATDFGTIAISSWVA